MHAKPMIPRIPHSLLFPPKKKNQPSYMAGPCAMQRKAHFQQDKPRVKWVSASPAQTKEAELISDISGISTISSSSCALPQALGAKGWQEAS